MGSLMIFFITVLVYLIGLSALRIKRLATKDLLRRSELATQARRIDAYALRKRRAEVSKRRATPSDFIGEYVDSLLGHQCVIAGTATQIEHWTKARYTMSPTSQTYRAHLSREQASDEWIEIDPVKNSPILKAVC